MAKSWREKLNKEDLPKIVELDAKVSQKMKGAKIMVVPHPKDVYEIMETVPEGKLITVNEIRKILAKKYRTDTACPLTTGIFIWIAANASAEMVLDGVSDKVIPYWRTLKSGGELVDKYPGGVEHQKEKLESEGFEVVKKGKKLVVKNFQKYLWEVDF